MIGTSRPAAQAVDHVDAVDAGQAEVEDDDVGMVARRELERDLAGRRAGRRRSRAPCRFVPSARRSCGSSSTDAGSRVHRAHALGALNDHRQCRRPGVSSITSSPSHRLDEPARDREAEPDAGAAAGSPSRWNGWNTCSRSRAGMPGPRSMTRRSTRVAAPRPASTRTGSSGGRPAQRVLDEVRDARSSSAASARTAGSVSGRRRRRRTPARRGSRARRARPPRGSTGARADVERAGLQPAHVEQVADERVEPVGLLVDRLEELVASSSASSRRRAGSRLDTDALIDASGVRRSCDTACSSAVRSSLASASVRRLRPPRPRARSRSSAAASCAANALST